MALFHHDFLPAFLQRAADRRLRGRELVHHHLRARLLLLQQLLDAGAVRPGEEAVDVSDLRVEAVVGGGADLHDGVAVRAEQLTQLRAHREDGLVRHLLAVLHPHLAHFLRERLVRVAARDHERAEVVALAGLVAAAMGRAAAGVEHVLVADGRHAQHVRLQEELHEVLRLRALDAELAAAVLLLLVERTVEAVSLHGGHGVGHGARTVVAYGQHCEQLFLLLGVQLIGEACLRCGHKVGQLYHKARRPEHAFTDGGTPTPRTTRRRAAAQARWSGRSRTARSPRAGRRAGIPSRSGRARSPSDRRPS